MPRIYTEFRISHESPEDKITWEKELDEAIKELGYRSRIEWLNAMFCASVLKADKRKKKV